MVSLLYGPNFSQCRCDISWGMFIFTRLMFSINFKPQTLKVYFFVYISRIYTSIHIHILYIVCFFQNMGLKETQEFPSPEQFVRNNYGKFTHHTEPHSNSNKSWSGEGDGEASDAEAMNQLASVVGGFVQVGQCLLFHFSASQYVYFSEGSLVSVELICLLYLVAGALLFKYFHIMGASELVI